MQENLEIKLMPRKAQNLKLVESEHQENFEFNQIRKAIF